jgi:hypothetical protein
MRLSSLFIPQYRGQLRLGHGQQWSQGLGLYDHAFRDQLVGQAGVA